MRVLLLFVDGLGLGEDDPSRNPVSQAHLFRLRLFRNRAAPDPAAALAPTDACLGVPGLPQSGTGLTTILTGINAAATVGHHVNGYCTASLAALLKEHSLFHSILAAGKAATFANAYTPKFFLERPRFLSVSTVAAEQAGLRLRTLDDLARGEAVYHDFTNRLLPERGCYLPPITPREAGGRLARLTETHAFTMYEHFLTDRAGHARDMERAVEILENLEAFLEAVLSAVNLEETLVVLTSDHGNLEDLSTKQHTTNPVPTLLWGRGAAAASASIRSLSDFAPTILRHLSVV